MVGLWMVIRVQCSHQAKVWFTDFLLLDIVVGLKSWSVLVHLISSINSSIGYKDFILAEEVSVGVKQS